MQLIITRDNEYIQTVRRDADLEVIKNITESGVYDSTEGMTDMLVINELINWYKYYKTIETGNTRFRTIN